MTAFAQQLIASALLLPPTPDDRLTLARIVLRTAQEALRGGDTAAAEAFMADCSLHLDAARGR